MTPKEKAKELVDKMRDEIPCHCDDWEQAKQCALIAVDEIIEAIGYNSESHIWIKVKQEIELL